METYSITTGGVFGEPVTVSVAQSLDGPWYTFESPTADGYYPTQPWAWDRTTHDWSSQELDWTKPVNPSLTGTDFAGLTVADAIDLYAGSAGGTGFDIDQFGLDWIQYVMVTDPANNQGEITGIADVAGARTDDGVALRIGNRASGPAALGRRSSIGSAPRGADPVRPARQGADTCHIATSHPPGSC